MYSNWSKLVLIFERSSLDLDLWKIVHSFRNEFFTCLFKIQNVQVIQNDVIKCCKMMSSNVAKWCHHIATSQQCGEIVFHVVIFAGSLEAAYSLNWGAQEIWGKGGGETLALLW